WKRRTCPATFRRSDQLIADVSKLPDTAVLPSDEIATARTGPPCPRNWACTGTPPRRKLSSAIKVLIRTAFAKPAGNARLSLLASCQCRCCDVLRVLPEFWNLNSTIERIVTALESSPAGCLMVTALALRNYFGMR